MDCPKCNSRCVYVVDTMHGDDGCVYRRRKCLDCGAKFHTIELQIGDNAKFKQGYADAYLIKVKNRWKKEKKDAGET